MGDGGGYNINVFDNYLLVFVFLFDFVRMCVG